jgi:hypothetical protein
MIKRGLLGFVMLIVVVSPVLALDLSEFPGMFTDNVRIVVGKSADAEDVVGAIDIMTTLQQRSGCGVKVGHSVLDTEVDELSSMNTIIVGGPCINSAAAKIMGYPQNCLEGFELNKGIIRLYEFDNGNIALLAAGTLAVDTRRVTNVLSNYQDFALNGNEMVVTGVSINDIKILK